MKLLYEVLGSKHYLIEYCLFEYLNVWYTIVNNRTQVQPILNTCH